MAQGVNENCFLDMGLKGKATTGPCKGQIVVNKLAFSITQAGEFDEDGSKNARITNFSPAEIVKEMDQSSPSICKACAEKRVFPKATITFVDGKNEPYYTVTLEGCQISKVSVNFQSGDPKPMETIFLDYRKSTWKRDTEVASYDLKENVAA